MLDVEVTCTSRGACLEALLLSYIPTYNTASLQESPSPPPPPPPKQQQTYKTNGYGCYTSQRSRDPHTWQINAHVMTYTAQIVNTLAISVKNTRIISNKHNGSKVTLSLLLFGGRNSSVGSAWARCQSVAGSILLWGHFPVEGIFPLELTWVQTPFPQNSFG